ncbi:penicillin-binding protein 2 [Marinihelvus fidelis]|uniref:Peptidoglycan D,D-transpeptidase FtsI n=1 Tax=Marinihelvus fidelis TaxID=2613842 RepID=A0A5N0T4D9_9GAMM|nr:penicillin-binding transpeptidase domain-containing protein [Marinihelvus fidelis]KAA9129721.1 penicillin-binding protein 2 [Marinihelvus fidelis]
MSRPADKGFAPGRVLALLIIFGCISSALAFRSVNLQVMESDFLQDQGEARYLRDIELPTTRGVISDRNGEPLAVSTPVESVWVNPKELLQAADRLPDLARVLGADADDLERRLGQRATREFVWLRRRLNPEVARQVEELSIPGVGLQREYRRFYPTGEVAAHMIGFTNIDDVGQEGLELAYNDWLSGEPGLKRVIRDRKGRTIEEVELLRESEPGQDLRLTIDRRLQYLAYRELKRSVLEHAARSGSVVVLDVQTGEVLAMVNLPSYNPNQPGSGAEGLRNRAITDVFEPGSVMKPFAIMSMLENGLVRPDTPVDTNPGYVYMSGYTIRDHHNYGVLDVTGLLTKSSNVGVSKLALQLEPERMWDTYTRVGFGEATGTGFPGESAGVLRNHRRWRPVEQATISYGYGVSVTSLQLAQAFAVIADEGRLRQPTLIAGSVNPPMTVTDPEIARQVAAMLETVPGPEGTGKQARVRNYRVAGKTGTSRKASGSGYAARYVASFAGFAPASNPRLVTVAVINDPGGDAYYGGAVAAPLFSNVMGGALRLLNIAPDDYQTTLVSNAAGGAQ